MTIAAGRDAGNPKRLIPRLIGLTAMILAVIRQVTKMAAITTNRCETFIITKAFTGYTQRRLNPVLSPKEVEHATNNSYPDNKHKGEGIRGLLEWQWDIHPVNGCHYS